MSEDRVSGPLADIDAESVLRNAWCDFGGNNMDADYWHAFSDAVNYTLKMVAACARDERPAGPRPSGLGGDSPASAVDEVEALDTIDKLKRENAELREALRPFADAVYDAGGVMLFSNTQPSRADWLGASTLLTQSSEGE